MSSISKFSGDAGGPDSIPQRRLSVANVSRPRTSAPTSRRLSSDDLTQIPPRTAQTADAFANARPESSTARAKAGLNSLRSSSEDSTASMTVTSATLPPPKKSSPTKNIISPDLKGPSAGSRRSGSSSASAISSLSSAAATKASSSNTSRTGIFTPARQTSPAARSTTDKRSPAGRVSSTIAGSTTSTRSPPTARSSPSMAEPKSKVRASPTSSSASVTSRVVSGRPSVRPAVTGKTASQSAVVPKAANRDSSLEPDQMVLPASARLAQLEEDNELLRQELQSFHTEECTDPEKLNLWRLRLLKNQNLQLEGQLNSMARSMAATHSLKAQLSASCSDLCNKVVEFRAHKTLPIPEPPAPSPPRRSPSPSPTQPKRSTSPAQKSAAGSPRSTPSTSRLSAATATSSSRLSSTAVRGTPSPSPSSASGFTSRRSPSPTSSPGSRSSPRLTAPSTSKPQSPKTETGSASQVTTPPPPPSPQVAVPLDWLDGVDEVAKGALHKLSTPATQGGLKGGDSPVPYAPSSDNAFVATAWQAVLPSVDAAQVLNLETKLAELHPRLLKTSALLDSVLLPYMPPETSGSLSKDLSILISDTFHAARALTHLSLLLPACAPLTQPTPSTSSSIKHPSDVQGSPPVTSPTHQPDPDTSDSQVSRGSPPNSLADWGVPSLEEVTASLPAFAGEAEEGEAEGQMRALLLTFRKAAEGWQRERLALNDEMDFYRGCHAAQAAYIKQVTSAGHGALEAVLEKGLQSLNAAAASVEQVTKTLTSAEAGEAAEERLRSIQAALPGLQRLLEVVPTATPSATGGRAAVLDPLEEEYQEQIKVVFNTLQSKRAAVYRQRSISGSPQTT